MGWVPPPPPAAGEAAFQRWLRRSRRFDQLRAACLGLTTVALLAGVVYVLFTR